MLNRSEFWGAIILIIGLALLAGQLDFIDYSIRHLLSSLWPIVLIILGIALIVKHKRPSGHFPEDVADARTRPDFKRIRHISKTFGDMAIDARDMEINGASYSTVFGDIQVTLKGARLDTGANHLAASTTFGDITIVVPGDMEAMAYCSSSFGDLYVFGKTASGISNVMTHKTPGYEKAGNAIQISARTNFGDVKIYQG